MKLVDPSGKEVTSKENKNAKELENQLHKQIEKLLEPIFNNQIERSASPAGAADAVIICGASDAL